MFTAVNDSANPCHLEVFSHLPTTRSLRGSPLDRRRGSRCLAFDRSSDGEIDGPPPKPIRLSIKSQKRVDSNRISDELIHEDLSQETLPMAPNFTHLQGDPMVDKLRTHLGVLHPIPAVPINRSIVGLFVFFFFFGAIVDKLWTWRKQSQSQRESQSGIRPQVPTSFSQFLEEDLQRKESVEWVNMVLGKLWKVYQEGIENWIIGLLQPVIDGLNKPEYVQRVEIKQFSLGNDPLSVRNVERRTSRRANDLQ